MPGPRRPWLAQDETWDGIGDRPTVVQTLGEQTVAHASGWALTITPVGVEVDWQGILRHSPTGSRGACWSTTRVGYRPVRSPRRRSSAGFAFLDALVDPGEPDPPGDWEPEEPDPGEPRMGDVPIVVGLHPPDDTAAPTPCFDSTGQGINPDGDRG